MCEDCERYRKAHHRLRVVDGEKAERWEGEGKRLYRAMKAQLFPPKVEPDAKETR